MFISNDGVDVSHHEHGKCRATVRNLGQEVVGRAAIAVNRLGREAPFFAQPVFVNAEFGGIRMDRVIGFDPAEVMKKVGAITDEELFGLARCLSVTSSTFGIGPESGRSFNVSLADTVVIVKVQKPYEIEMSIRMLSQGGAPCPPAFSFIRYPAL